MGDGVGPVSLPQNPQDHTLEPSILVPLLCCPVSSASHVSSVQGTLTLSSWPFTLQSPGPFCHNMGLPTHMQLITAP